eukprot:GHVS01080367.1.p1 GENE.GHVS01080367.1~~GHVS01080367.1.p1  ORF type:complete len:237 (-),score=52.91 GHVS01080367.1:462-1097(-)
MSAQSPSTRKQCDFTKLMMAGYELELNNGSTQDFYVTFHGPKETAYEGGVWKVHVTLPEDYPFASPSIGFMNKVLHPNVDEASGSVCLDVINQTWTPLYSLVNIFDVFLPQLLTYPNPSDPLNSEAAALLMADKTVYEKRINEYVKLYASQQPWPRREGASSSGSHSRLRKDEIKGRGGEGGGGMLTPVSDMSEGEDAAHRNYDDIDIDDL